MPTATEQTRAFLDQADEVRASSQAWLMRMRTPDMPLGYFRNSDHALHPWSLYSSNSALAVYWRLRLPMTESERRSWGSVFLDNYRADLGLFLCPQVYGSEFRGDIHSYEDRCRADGAGPFKKLAAKLFQLTGEMPPTPDEGTLGFAEPAELGRFFDQKHGEQVPYGFGSTMGDFFHKRMLWLRGQGRPTTGDPWIEWGYAYLEGVRDPETGMITGANDDPTSQMNGLFKLCCSTFWAHGRPIPDARKVVDHVLQLARADAGFGQHCADYNATSLLTSLCLQEVGYRYEEIMATLSGPVIQRFEERRKPDGAFSFHPAHCITHQNRYHIADPLPESDLVGTGQQLTVLDALEALALQKASFTPQTGPV